MCAFMLLKSLIQSNLFNASSAQERSSCHLTMLFILFKGITRNLTTPLLSPGSPVCKDITCYIISHSHPVPLCLIGPNLPFHLHQCKNYPHTSKRVTEVFSCLSQIRHTIATKVSISLSLPPPKSSELFITHQCYSVFSSNQSVYEISKQHLAPLWPPSPSHPSPKSQTTTKRAGWHYFLLQKHIAKSLAATWPSSLPVRSSGLEKEKWGGSGRAAMPFQGSVISLIMCGVRDFWLNRHAATWMTLVCYTPQPC